MHTSATSPRSRHLHERHRSLLHLAPFDDPLDTVIDQVNLTQYISTNGVFVLMLL